MRVVARVAAGTVGGVVGSVRLVAFWAAVMLPFLWLPLVVEGVSTGDEFRSLVVLVTANLAAMVVGHRHRPARF